jgi:hypothetical protein
MANYPLNRIVFNKDTYERVIDTSFSQVTPPAPPVEDTISVEEFFNLYNTIFYDIPVEGDINSHTYLVKTSGEYVGGATINEDVQLLLDEITSLRQDLLAANQTVLSLQTTIPISSSNSSSMTII